MIKLKSVIYDAPLGIDRIKYMERMSISSFLSSLTFVLLVKSSKLLVIFNTYLYLILDFPESSKV